MELACFVLVLQIGFNAALNNRGFNSNSMIPSQRFVNFGHTRRLPEADAYVPLSSRGILGSEEHSDSEYSSSFEDYSYRRVKPLYSRANQRRSGYLRYNSRPENDESLEAAPVGRINSESHQPSSLSLRRWTNPNYRRPNSRPSNFRRRQIRKHFRKANDDSSLEVSSLESNNPEDTSRLGEEANYLRSLLSLIERTNNRRGKIRKYYKQGNNLSIDVSPINKLDPNEHVVNSPNSLQQNSNQKDDLRYGEPSSTKDVNDVNILLVADEEKSNGIPKLETPEQTGFGDNNLNTRRNGGVRNINDNNLRSITSYRRLKPRPELTNDSPLTRRLNKNSNDNSRVEWPLNDNTEKVTVLRLGSIEDLNLKPSVLRSDNNKTNNHRNFFRLSLSNNNKVALDESVASDLSELVSDTLVDLNLAPVNLRRNEPSNIKNSRRKNNRLRAENNNPSNLSILRLGSFDIPKAVSPLQTRPEPVNRRSNINVTHGNHTRQVSKNVFDEDTAKTLVPYHEGQTIKLSNNRRDKKENNTKTDNDFSDEFSLDSLFAFRKEVNLSSNDKNIPKDTIDVLHLEFPWNDQLSQNDGKGTKISGQAGLRSKSKYKSPEQNENAKDTTNELHLEFPWNDALNPDDDKGKSKLRINKEKDKTEDTTDTLHLQFPWNDALSSDNGNKSKSKLRINNEKDNTEDTTDTLHLEYPWNGELNAEGDKDKSKLRTDEKEDQTKDSSDTLHLEFPWNDVLSPEDKGKPQLRNNRPKENNKDTPNTLHLEFPWNGELSSEGDEDKSKLRTDENKYKSKDYTDTLELEYPWNSEFSSDSDKSKQLRSKEKTKNTTDALHLEFPWNDQLSPEETKTGRPKTVLRTQVDDRQDNEPKDELKLEFPWNGQISPDKPSSKKTTARTPDPFFIHPYLRGRNINKHPNYFRRSLDEDNESHRLDHLRPSPSESLIRLGEVGLAREGSRETDEDLSDIITFPSDRRHSRA